jgi:hypothetical protein
MLAAHDIGIEVDALHSRTGHIDGSLGRGLAVIQEDRLGGWVPGQQAHQLRAAVPAVTGYADAE